MVRISAVLSFPTHGERLLCSRKVFCCFLFDQGPFCEATGILCFGLRMTLVPMGFKARLDSPSLVLFCHWCAMIPRTISGCQDWASNLNHSPLKRERCHYGSPAHMFQKGVDLATVYCCEVGTKDYLNVECYTFRFW